MDLTLKKRIFYFFPLLFCFCLPFGSLVLSAMIAMWLLISFFNMNTANFISGIKNKNLWLLWSFFLLTLISAAFSSNKSEAVFSIEVKLTLIAFPFLIYCFEWPPQLIKKCIVSFVSGCFFACLYLIVRASLYAFNGHAEYFFYTLFSDLIHASYMAMYLVLAISIILIYYPTWFKDQKQVLYLSYLFMVVFIITIFLCSSKLGIISLFVTLPILFIYRSRKFFSVKKAALLTSGLIILMFIALKLFPDSIERLRSITSFSTQNIDKTSSESTTVRVLIWEQCIEIIKDNFIFGVTAGDANDELYKAYEKNGLTGALSHKLNAHNQFFQTFIGLGIFGFILLLLLTFGQFIKGIVQKNIILVIFSLIIILNFMVESMLQTSAGTLFYVFFFCVFNHQSLKNEFSV